MKITGCPRRLVSAGVWDALEYAQHAEHGAWPVGGGVLEQSVSFRQAIPTIRSLKQYVNGR